MVAKQEIQDGLSAKAAEFKEAGGELYVQHVIVDEGSLKLGQDLVEGEVPEDELREHVQKAVDAALAEAGTPLSTADRTRLVREITSNILGYGPIEPFPCRQHPAT